MVTLKRKVYTSNNSIDVTLSRLRLDIEKASLHTSPIAVDVTVDTNKPWVGRIEEATTSFEIIQTNPYLSPLRFLEGNFFSIIIRGNLYDEGTTTKIKVNFDLGWRSLIGFLPIYLFSIIILINTVVKNNLEELKKEGGLWLIFTFLLTLLLKYQLDSSDRKIKKSLGIR